MANSPIYLAVRRNASVAVTVANTNLDGTSGTRAQVFIAGANGSLVESVQIKSIISATSTVVADMVRIWVGTSQTACYLIKEVAVPAGAGAIGVTYAEFDAIVALNIALPNGTSLFVSSHVSTNGYHATAMGGDY